MRVIARWVALASLLGALGAGVSASAAPRTGFEPISAEAQAASLRAGVNVLGFDPLWQDPAKRQFKAYHFARIRQAGFRTVRVVLFGFRHMDAQDRLDPRWLQSLDGVVDDALANDLNVILENQDMAWCGQNAEACKPRLTAFWAQVAERYRDRPNRVLFELLNEPNNQLDAVWNAWIPELLAMVRKTNPERNVVVDAIGWAHVSQLPKLQLPAGDRHLIATFHYYDPRPFTHQGAAFAEPQVRDLADVAWGSAADRERLHADFAAAGAWSAASGRPILLGEFGVYDKAPMESRTRYLDAVAREAEANGWPWIYWQFDHDFVVYDMNRDEWVEPVLRALAPDRH